MPSPRRKSWDVLAWAEGDVGVVETAKDLFRDLGIKVGRDRLFALLGDYGWIYRAGPDGRGRPCQGQVEDGRLSMIPQSHYQRRTGELVLDAPQVGVRVRGYTNCAAGLRVKVGSL
ncbi:phage antirepressor KilAC domain-containing protein [Actinopolymorpha pittospori]|uniref:Phage antirepressor YoqD-like protein n=1 Tax=Actinopolymorpha pittospori TaxID=648752 RepID=A0A927MQ29_9ACTN|nr:phage antirepressor KilAC domain-containing protein [Actinopolymorpha pittospori]MBE1604805.1 phage antirepressor YoqD-like protein [Actinopolymorpha pittospori]